MVLVVRLRFPGTLWQIYNCQIYNKESITVDFIMNSQVEVSHNASVDLAVIKEYHEEPAVRIVFILAMTIFSVAGFIGNSLIIATIALVPDLRTTRNAFLVNLAVSDLVLIVVVVPYNVLSVIHGGAYWESRLILCNIVASVCAPGCLSAIWSNTAIAFNRYFFICHQDIYDRWFAPWRTFLWICLTWLISFSIHLPNHFGWGRNSYVKQFFMCTKETNLWTYSTFFAIVGIAIPLLISFVSYCKIYQLVRTTKSARNQIVARFRNAPVDQDSVPTFDQTSNGISQSEANPSIIVVSNTDADPESASIRVLRSSKRRSRAFQRELTLVRTLFRSFAVFVVAWLPLAVLLMLAPVIDVVLPSSVYLLTIFLAHGSTATNSVLYYSTNRQFRRSFRAMTAKYLSARVKESRRKPGPGRIPDVVKNAEEIVLSRAHTVPGTESIHPPVSDANGT